MKLFLLLLLMAFIPIQQQVEREDSDLQVVKFGWVKDKQPSSSMIRGAQNPIGPVTSSVNDGRDLGSRKADLRTAEKNASASAPKAADSYSLRIELKNTGANVVRGLVWEFRPNAGPEDYQPKQYLCALQVKPGEKKILEIWTPYLPVKVVSADKIKDPQKDGTVVINKIDYADGSVWTKPGWNYKLPANSLQKLSDGGCSTF